MQPAFPRAVIFDWDNTLVDNWPAIATAINDTFEKFGLPQWTTTEVKQRCNRAARDSFPEWFGNQWEKAHDFFYARFETIHLKKLEKLRGAEDLLQWLVDTKMPVFVVSNKRGDYLRQQVHALGWDHFFIALVGSQDTAKDKPARDPVDYALSQASLIADALIWFVGDTAIDILCAENAGCTSILINNDDDALKMKAVLTFSDCHKLKAALVDLHNLGIGYETV